MHEMKWRKLARAVAYDVGLRGQDVEDAEQEGVVKAWCLRDKPEAYIYTSVKNAVTEHARGRYRRATREKPLFENSASGTINEEYVAAKIEAEKLDEQAKEYLVHIMDGLTADEASDAVGASSSSVRVRLHRFRKSV